MSFFRTHFIQEAERTFPDIEMLAAPSLVVRDPMHSIRNPETSRDRHRPMKPLPHA
jgi:hypothetical protein